MVKPFIIGLLAGIFLCGGLWIYLGRIDTKPIYATAKQISESNRKAEQISDTIRKRYDQIAGTVAELDTRGARIKSISLTVASRSEGLAGSSGRIESGIKNVKESVDRIENRNREVVSIINSLRKTNEDFRESIK